MDPVLLKQIALIMMIVANVGMVAGLLMLVIPFLLGK